MLSLKCSTSVKRLIGFFPHFKSIVASKKEKKKREKKVKIIFLMILQIIWDVKSPIPSTFSFSCYA